MKRLLLAASFLALACSSKKAPADTLDKEKVGKLQSLRTQLKEAYLKETESHIGHWPSDHDCDGALWAGIARAADIKEVDISLALTKEGRPTRRPGSDCGPQDSSATTSTDMMLGTIVGLFAAGDLDGLEKMDDYSARHNGIMGQPENAIPLTLIKPGTKAHLANSINALGGPSSTWQKFPQVYTPPAHDYELHLEMLSVYQSLVTRHGVDFLTYETVVKEASNNPNDALVQALRGNVNHSADLLLDSSWQVPHYVRGPETAPLVHKLFVLHMLITPYE